MSDQTKIEWADSTLNPWIGCTKISPACDHCYAESMMDTRMGRVKWGAGQPRQRTSAANWRKPVLWNARPYWSCAGCGWRGDSHAYDLCDEEAAGGVSIRCPICSGKLTTARRRVFCASLADVFDNEVPVEWLVDLLDLIRRTPSLDWLLLTKRIGNVRSRLSRAVNALDTGYRRGEPTGNLCDWIEYWLGGGAPPANVWLGATICNQPEADRDIQKLLAVPARVRFLSIEPMLGPVNLNRVSVMNSPTLGRHTDALRGHSWDESAYEGGSQPLLTDPPDHARIDWVIAGGESGPHARPMHPDWVRSLRDQCAASGVAFMFKQWGEFAPNGFLRKDGTRDESIMWMDRMGKRIAGRELDGRTHTEFPE